MKLRIIFFAVVAISQLTVGQGPNLVCYYDADSEDRAGEGFFTLSDLEFSIEFCSHVVYGYAGLNANTFELVSLNPMRDIQKRTFAHFTTLKERYPNIKFLLSVGGDKDDAGSYAKYESLLEAGPEKEAKFIESALYLMRAYNFDGLDLAFQFRRNEPRRVQSAFWSLFFDLIKRITEFFLVDNKMDAYKMQFTTLVADLKQTFEPYNLLLTLTVLPNVNSSWYFNAPVIIKYLDFVNLMTFDFTTPERNPEEADYTAPLFAPEPMKGNRLPHYNANFQLEYWIKQGVPSSKLNLGIASYGRAWKMTSKSKNIGIPIISYTKGPAPAGSHIKIPGLLSWPEVCKKLTSPSNLRKTGDEAPLYRVEDMSQKTGVFAFRPADSNGEHGMWVSYEDPETAASKADYVRSRGIGGVALFDLSLDDFRGNCIGEKMSILRAIKYKFL